MPHKRLGCTFVPSAPQQTWVADGGGVQMDLQAALERALAGHYQVIREIGRGGMAVVYECRDLIAERSVAIKLLYPDLARALGGERFLREIRILQQLNHPNILPLLDSGSLELLPGVQLPWYAMPLAREETLRARLAREGALPLATALGYARDLCAALTHAHGQGVIHRDIKPENVLLVEGRAVLADFGIARAITVAGGDTLSTTGIVVGTPAYMSPEQSTGARQLDGRSDLYSLGVVLYEMLAGHAPFSGSTPQAVSARHQFEAPPPIVVVRPGLPVGVTAVLERALAKLAADRFQGAEAFDTSLSVLPQVVLSPRKARGRRIATFLALTSIVVLSAGAILRRQIRTDLPSASIAVLPLSMDRAGESLCGSECGALIDDALAEWADFPTIDQLRVRSAVGTTGGPHDLRESDQAARSLGAGRFIWGSVLRIGDSIRVRVVLNQLQRVGSREVRSASITLPLRSGDRSQDSALAILVATRFAALARNLVAPDDSTTIPLQESVRTGSLAALRLKLRGDSSLSRWDLVAARDRYRAALRIDTAYAQAHLLLAQIGSWLRDPAELWATDATRAYEWRSRLTPRQQMDAAALHAIAIGQPLRACGIYERLIARDSSDFTAWFGLGECLARDGAVVPSPSSPSHVAFRSSYESALAAYDRALTLLPSTHRAFVGPTLDALLDRYFVESNRLRIGRAIADSARIFAAFPVSRGDTIGFIPRPISEVLAGTWPNEHPGDVYEMLRRRLLRVTAAGVKALPTDHAAWRAHAEVLELAGDLAETADPGNSALMSYRLAGLNGGGPTAQMAVGIAQVRVLIKLNRGAEAARLADSLLGQRRPLGADENNMFAGLAAYRGDVSAAVRYARAGASHWLVTDLEGQALAVAESLASDGVALQLFAVFHGPADSVNRLHQRVIRSTGGERPNREQVRLRAALLDRTTVLAFPLLGPPESAGMIQDIERAIWRRDTAAAVSMLGRLSTARLGKRSGEIGSEGTVLESRLYLQIGDSSASRMTMERMRENLSTLGRDLLTDLPQAASIGLSSNSVSNNQKITSQSPTNSITRPQ